MTRDLLDILPYEICIQCFAETCSGDDYMADLLMITTVSRRWCQFLTQTPTLWTIINIKNADEDSMETIFTFLHLSGSADLSLTVWVPFSGVWYSMFSILRSHRNRIIKVVLRADEPMVSDIELQHSLQEIFGALGFPDSVRYMDIVADRPIKMTSTWIPRNLASLGNWLIPLSILEPSSPLIRTLHHLSIGIIHLLDLFPRLSTFVRLRSIHIYSEKQDYSSPIPEQSHHTNPLNLSLQNLRYQGRF
jgi:hypothetical protein